MRLNRNTGPPVIDKATTEELFMLMPQKQLVEGSNQLVKVSDATMCTMPL
jgi:hypothetical protein